LTNLTAGETASADLFMQPRPVIKPINRIRPNELSEKIQLSKKKHGAMLSTCSAKRV
jgi:hypothetical protein